MYCCTLRIGMFLNCLDLTEYPYVLYSDQLKNVFGNIKLPEITWQP